MRGRPKSLKPLLTGPIERVLRQVAAEDPAAAGLLALWWADQYHALVDVLDATDADNDATPEALADALEAAETLDPPASLDERWRVFLPLLRERRDCFSLKLTYLPGGALAEAVLDGTPVCAGTR